eukprot:m.388048 g.388048  ORF g.388048 m.388048 type:complete len:53 (+) comp165753_c0_seq1:3-161(+)
MLLRHAYIVFGDSVLGVNACFNAVSRHGFCFLVFACSLMTTLVLFVCIVVGC